MKSFSNYLSKIVLFSLCAVLFVSLMACEKPDPHAKEKAELKTKLTEIFGTKETILPAYLSKIQPGMTCEDLQKSYTTLKCDRSKEGTTKFYPKAEEVTVSDNPMIEKLRFTFINGKIDVVTIKFKKGLSPFFKDISTEVVEDKWAKLPADSRELDKYSMTHKSDQGSLYLSRSIWSNKWWFSFTYTGLKAAQK